MASRYIKIPWKISRNWKHIQSFFTKDSFSGFFLGRNSSVILCSICFRFFMFYLLPLFYVLFASVILCSICFRFLMFYLLPLFYVLFASVFLWTQFNTSTIYGWRYSIRLSTELLSSFILDYVLYYKYCSVRYGRYFQVRFDFVFIVMMNIINQKFIIWLISFFSIFFYIFFYIIKIIFLGSFQITFRFDLF